MEINNNNVCICIPRHGLGDILYNCLALKFMIDKGLIESAIVFTPIEAKEIPELFGLESMCSYPFFFRLSRLSRKDILNLDFFLRIRKYRNNKSFSLINDVFDAIINYFYQLKPITEWSIGNYCLLGNSGSRGFVNRRIKYNNNTNNPKHILKRVEGLLTSLVELDCDILRRNFSVDFHPKLNKDFIHPSILILPDAADSRRFISLDIIKEIFTRKNCKDIMVISERSDVEKMCIEYNVKYIKYPTISSLFEIVYNSTTVYSSDSFGAHVAGLFNKDMYIFYPDYLYKHWEFWGVPSVKAKHVYNNKIFFLDSKTCKTINSNLKFI